MKNKCAISAGMAYLIMSTGYCRADGAGFSDTVSGHDPALGVAMAFLKVAIVLLVASTVLAILYALLKLSGTRVSDMCRLIWVRLKIRIWSRGQYGWDYRVMLETARSVWLKQALAWNNSKAGELRSSMTGGCYAGYELERNLLRARGERRVTDDIDITRIALLQALRRGGYGDCFVVRVDGRKTDYTLDSNSGALSAGSKQPLPFSDRMKFVRYLDGWILDELQAGERRLLVRQSSIQSELLIAQSAIDGARDGGNYTGK